VGGDRDGDGQLCSRRGGSFVLVALCGPFFAFMEHTRRGDFVIHTAIITRTVQRSISSRSISFAPFTILAIFPALCERLDFTPFCFVHSMDPIDIQNIPSFQIHTTTRPKYYYSQSQIIIISDLKDTWDIVHLVTNHPFIEVQGRY